MLVQYVSLNAKIGCTKSTKYQNMNFQKYHIGFKHT